MKEDMMSKEASKIISELENENQELKQKYLNAVADYEKTRFEKEQLKKQLKDKMEDYKRMKDNFDSKVEVLTKIETQQKEFVKYLEDEIKNIQIKWGNQLTENGYIDIAMTVRAYQIILQKYKEITRGK